MSAPSPAELLVLAKAARKAGRVDHPVAGPLGFATPEYWRFIQECTPAVIAALCERLAHAERSVEDERSVNSGLLDLLPVNYMTAPLEPSDE